MRKNQGRVARLGVFGAALLSFLTPTQCLLHPVSRCGHESPSLISPVGIQCRSARFLALASVSLPDLTGAGSRWPFPGVFFADPVRSRWRPHRRHLEWRGVVSSRGCLHPRCWSVGSRA
ncbi:hypothetical protein CDL15_Pgr003574 [Punica granatum]|uniref:Secreted protein n=1 Tax=Punica granatum TaxID=22663 RepID=A0A218XV64_PUNGR|nr:hypothetical protein CDL15_Pgr003574 [Punica granatum]